MEQSGLKEAGNILASAYLNALSDFMGMMLVPSVPSLVVDLSGAVLTTAYLNFGHERDFVFCVETSFRVEGTAELAAGPLPAAARHAVPAGHLRRHPTDLIRCRDPCFRSAISPSSAPSPAGSTPPTPAPTTTSASSTIRRGLIEEAIAEFVRALQLDPRMHVAQTNLDIAYRESGHYDRRITELRDRVRRRPEDRDARWELGRAHAALGQHAEAIAEFQALLALAPRRCPAMLQLGLAEKARGQPRHRAATGSSARLRAGPRERGRPVLLRRGAVQPRPQCARARRAHRGDRAEPGVRRSALPPGVRARRHGPARGGPRVDPAGDQAQSDAGARAGEPGARAGERRRTGNGGGEGPEMGGRRPAARPVQVVEGGALAHYNLGSRAPAEGLPRRRRSPSTASRSRRARTPGSASRRSPKFTCSSATFPPRSSSTTDWSREYPDSPKLWNERGVCLHQAGRRAEALASYEQAVAIDPAYQLAWNNLGVVRAHEARR